MFQLPVSPNNLYITLVRGIPGIRRLHRRMLEALRLQVQQHSHELEYAYCRGNDSAGEKVGSG
ncbi:hypothetical protein OROGR_003144 [Orobanche gracilis]